MRLGKWVGILPVLGGLAVAQATGTAAPAPLLPPPIQAAWQGFGGHVSFAAVNVETGARLEWRADVEVPTASTIKLPIMVEAAYQVAAGRLTWDQPLHLSAADKVPGSGILQDLSEGLTLTLGDAVTLMIVESDNTATNLVLDKVGISAVNTRMQALGLQHTVLFKKVFRPPPGPPSPDQARFGLGKTTASDMLTLLRLLQAHRLVTPAACDWMLRVLAKQRDEDGFPRYMDQLRPRLGALNWAHKTGALDDVRNDVGILPTSHGTLILAAFAYDSPDHTWSADNAATLVLARLALASATALLP